MTTPVTTSELFTLTGVLSCAKACALARMMKAAVNTVNRKTALFITASHNTKALQAHLYCPTWGGLLSVISDRRHVISDHKQKYWALPTSCGSKGAMIAPKSHPCL